MDIKIDGALLKNKKTTEWTINQPGYVTLLFGGFILLGCAIAYVVAVARGTVEPFLPLISDAAGSPPQNGLFGTCICLGGLFGVTFMGLRYMIVKDKNLDNSVLVNVLNRISLVVGFLSMLGITLVTGYPINFYRNKEVWLMDVGIPHMVGGVMLFALGVLYTGLQCIITLFLRPKYQLTLVLRVGICLVCTASFVYHMITVPMYFGGLHHLYSRNTTEIESNGTKTFIPYPNTMGSDLRLPIDTSGSYTSSAISEWILVVFFCSFFFTFFHEAQRYSVLIIVETQVRAPDGHDGSLSTVAYSRSNSQVDSKPPPELRKFMRCDSTSQTMTDTLETAMTKDTSNGNAKKSRHVKDAKAKLKLAKVELDAKLNKFLNKKEKETEDPERKSESEPGPEISSDSEEKTNQENSGKSEEDIAIEKIEIIIQDAEESSFEEAKMSSDENEKPKEEQIPEKETS